MNVQSRPLKVAALGMEQRTYNTLQLFFSDRCDNLYVLSDEKSADIFIIDMDGFQASKVLESHKKYHPHQPAILISLKENSDKDSVFVRKPIQLSALASALDEAKKRLAPVRMQTPPAVSKHNNHSGPSGNTPAHLNSATPSRSRGEPVLESRRDSARSNHADNHPKHQPKNQPAHNAGKPPDFAKHKTVVTAPAPRIQYFVNTERLKAIQEESKKFLKTFQERAQPPKKPVKAKPIAKSAMDFKPGVNDSGIRFIGDLNANFNPRNPSLISKLQYNAESTLLGYVSLAYKIALSSSSNVIVEGPWRPILILYKTKEICVERDFRHLFALSATTFKKEEVSIYGQDQDNNEVLSEQMLVQPLEQFMWKLALRTSQGRVPQGTDLESPVKLIRWPNFTRYEVTPHALRIAALWAKHPASLVDTAKILMIPQQYVFAFYSATFATNMVMHVSETKPHEFTTPILARGANRNMFQHLLDRLRRL